MEAGEINDQQGSVAERSKALVLGTSLFGGVGSNPTAASYFLLAYSAHEILQGWQKTSSII